MKSTKVLNLFKRNTNKYNGFNGKAIFMRAQTRSFSQLSNKQTFSFFPQTLQHQIGFNTRQTTLFKPLPSLFFHFTKKSTKKFFSTEVENKEQQEVDNDQQFEEIKKFAETGNPKAQFELSFYYLSGNKYVDQDVKKALQLLEESAAKGEFQAYVQLGDLYSRGYEVTNENGEIDEEQTIKQNLLKSFSYFQEAASKGYPAAQGNVGVYYLTGVGVKKNLNEAQKWLQLASDNGNLTARCNLANCYLTGIDPSDNEGEILENPFQQDQQKAISLLKSCLDEFPDFHVAAYHLGIVYYHGEGVETNLREAYEYFYDASQNGNMEANHYLALYYENGLLDGDTNLNKAITYYEKAASIGYPPAQHSLALLYLNYDDENQEENREKGKDYLLKSASKGYVPSIYHVGLEYLNNPPNHPQFPNNSHEAVKWLQRAADLGFEEAQMMIGLCHYKGQGFEKDTKKAIEILSEVNIPESCFLLGGIYETGDEDIPVDFEKAFMWYQLADAGGDLDAKYRLGLCYHYGKGVTQDKQQGLMYLQEASKLGHEAAKRAIMDLHFRGSHR